MLKFARNKMNANKLPRLFNPGTDEHSILIPFRKFNKDNPFLLGRQTENYRHLPVCVSRRHIELVPLPALRDSSTTPNDPLFTLKLTGHYLKYTNNHNNVKPKIQFLTKLDTIDVFHSDQIDIIDPKLSDKIANFIIEAPKSFDNCWNNNNIIDTMNSNLD